MKSLIIYFSRKDENYGVGKISKGNTEVIAEYIKKYTGADVFQCVPANPYPEDYKATAIKLWITRSTMQDRSWEDIFWISMTMMSSISEGQSIGENTLMRYTVNWIGWISAAKASSPSPLMKGPDSETALLS